MRLTFLGADHEVTGSATLIEINGHYGLVDYGMEQGKNVFVNQPLPIPESQLEFVLLTHAHIDHSGNIPLLAKNGFHGAIYATDATCRLANIMLKDCAHIKESEAEWQNRKGQRAGDEPVQPAYTMEDAEAALKLFSPCSYNKKFHILDGVEIRFIDAGHLLGSASIEVWLTEGEETRKVVFSGDIGNFDQPIIKNPQYIDEADFVITESTYGDRLHEMETKDNVPFLAECIQKVLDRGGNVVIPAFAVGRAQEMLYYIREIKEQGLVRGHDGFPVYLDSPLANEATEVFSHTDIENMNDETRAIFESGENPLDFDGLFLSITADESKAINFDTEPKVIIAASGMCEEGRIRHHLKHNLWRSECMLLFVGFQAVVTLGRKIYDGARTVTLFGEDISVNAEIAYLGGKSGHADMNGLITWITAFQNRPKMVFVNHGEDAVVDSYVSLLEKQFELTASGPFSGARYNLLTEEYEEKPAGIPIDKDAAKKKEGTSLYSLLVAAGERLLAVIRGMKGAANKDVKKLTNQINDLVERWK